MGKRGPTPEPVEKGLRKGSARAKRRAKVAPRSAGMPEKPAWLRGDALKCWKVLLPMLDAMGVLGRVDSNVLAQYCVVWGRWMSCRKVVDRRGVSYETQDTAGNPVWKKRPEVELELRYLRECDRLGAEFGLSPSARASLAIEPTAVARANKADSDTAKVPPARFHSGLDLVPPQAAGDPPK